MKSFFNSLKSKRDRRDSPGDGRRSSESKPRRPSQPQRIPPTAAAAIDANSEPLYSAVSTPPRHVPAAAAQDPYGWSRSRSASPADISPPVTRPLPPAPAAHPASLTQSNIARIEPWQNVSVRCCLCCLNHWGSMCFAVRLSCLLLRDVDQRSRAVTNECRPISCRRSGRVTRRCGSWRCRGMHNRELPALRRARPR